MRVTSVVGGRTIPNESRREGGMTIVNEIDYEPVTDPNDPDDYRPGSRLAFVFDPGDVSGRTVRNLHFIFEVASPGEGAPLHVHPVDEAILVEGGEMEVRIGDSVERVRPEGVAFIPRGLAHAWRSVGESDLRLRAVFPTDFVVIRYLERNPAPGTEEDAPRPPWWLDLRDSVLLGSASQGSVVEAGWHRHKEPCPRLESAPDGLFEGEDAVLHVMR